MVKFTTTTIAALLIVIGVAFSAYADEKGLKTGSRKVRVTSLEGSRFKLTYLVQGRAAVAISIYDASGDKVFSESISNKKSFERPYNMKGMPKGKYSLEVKDAVGSFTKKLDYKIWQTTEERIEVK